MGDTLDFDEIKLRRLRNLKMFKGKTDDEIVEYMQNRPEKTIPTAKESSDIAYNKKFQKLLKSFQDEYGVDMNNSNDSEALINLVRHSLQLEKVNDQIIEMQQSDHQIDTRVLKNLGDYQRSLVTSISEFQNSLGINRKMRKEKQMDDVPQFIESLKTKALEFWERKTVKIICAKCDIELSRYWLNFPQLANTATFELECWKCGEKIVYVH